VFSQQRDVPYFDNYRFVYRVHKELDERVFDIINIIKIDD